MKFNWLKKMVAGMAIAALSACGGGGGDDDTSSADDRNGEYIVHATDGREYTLTVDFDAMTYTMAGNGLDESGEFEADASESTYTIAGNARFKTATDLVVGGYDFGDGVVPFVAAREFVTSMDELGGHFNMFGLNISAAGSVDSRIFTLELEPNELRACLSNIIYAPQNCPVESIWTYALTLDGNLFSGFDAAHEDRTSFRIAKSGDTLIYLRAGAATNGTDRRFRIGFTERNGLGSGSFSGASSSGSWGTAAVTNTSYDVVGVAANGQALTDEATLDGLSQFNGMRLGQRVSDDAFVFVLRDGPLAVLIGARGGPAVGYMEIGLGASDEADDDDNGPAAYAGDYSGSFSGAESGTWAVSISADGTLTGDGTSTTSGSFGISGSVTSSGSVTLNATAGSAGIAEFSGSINAETGAVSGTWRYIGSASDDGTFSGQRQ